MPMSGNKVTVISERKLNRNGATVYHDTIERKPGEVINVFDPNEIKNRTRHVKLQNSLAQKEQMMSLTQDEKLLVFCLSYYLDWETNTVIGDGQIGQKNYPLKASDIDRIAGLDRRRRIRAVKGLMDKNILAYTLTEHRRKAYVMNPEWALNGRNPQEALLNTFNSKIDVENEQELYTGGTFPEQE